VLREVQIGHISPQSNLGKALRHTRILLADKGKSIKSNLHHQIMANTTGPEQVVTPLSDITHASLQVLLQRAWSIAQPW